MKNEYLRNLEKIEFVVTDACTGKCRHCSEGEHDGCREFIDARLAADALRRIAAEYELKTVMCFGGEPLLHIAAVEEIMRAALEMGIPRRQLITNGYFSAESEKIREAAERLSACGVCDLLLSVDAFHQEAIPLEVVKTFAKEALKCGIPVRLSPAWLVSREDANPYNEKTREVLAEFSELNIPTGEGNVVFPEGNALKYLFEYFADGAPENPYVEDERDVRCVSFSANGDVLNGNFYRRDVMEILKNYAPKGE